MQPVDRVLRSVAHVAREAALVSAGLAVLTYQELQVWRREQERARAAASTGDRQVFPPAAVMAACLRQGVGLEVMTNAAAARTFSLNRANRSASSSASRPVPPARPIEVNSTVRPLVSVTRATARS